MKMALMFIFSTTRGTQGTIKMSAIVSGQSTILQQVAATLGALRACDTHVYEKSSVRLHQAR